MNIFWESAIIAFSSLCFWYEILPFLIYKYHFWNSVLKSYLAKFIMDSVIKSNLAKLRSSIFYAKSTPMSDFRLLNFFTNPDLSRFKIVWRSALVLNYIISRIFLNRRWIKITWKKVSCSLIKNYPCLLWNCRKCETISFAFYLYCLILVSNMNL